ncbi:MAG: hypothetical protein J6X74_02255 [Bacteroidaceae bacterium]|nr:hypothetical protein [Bacteroidaceae bacterium]
MNVRKILTVVAMMMLTLSAYSQAKDTTKVRKFETTLSRLSLGGYGEVALSRNFYSDHFNRYKDPASYSGKSHGRFDIPHVVLNIGYDFGKGWSFGSELEYEHGGTESAVEIDAEESGEFEAETEKGGEVALEQFWINKQFWKGELNVKAGEIIVPVGYMNQYHLPTEFFTVYRPEGENTILPNTWHQVGISLWGRTQQWRYEVQLLSGLDSERFKRNYFVHYGANSPYEFKIANSYAVSARVDNYSIKGLRIGVSGYYGHSFRNTLAKIGTEYDGVKGALAIISGDFTLNRFNWIARGNFTYAHLGDADKISEFNKSNYTHHKYQDGSPFANENLGSSAIAWGIEAGYDIFSQIHKTRALGQKLYVFGRYEYYNSMFRGTYKNLYKYTAKNRLAFGVNYYPIKQVVVKGEYSYRFFKKPNNNGLTSDSPLYVQPYNNEPSINIGIAYSGWFL